MFCKPNSITHTSLTPFPRLRPYTTEETKLHFRYTISPAPALSAGSCDDWRDIVCKSIKSIDHELDYKKESFRRDLCSKYGWQVADGANVIGYNWEDKEYLYLWYDDSFQHREDANHLVENLLTTRSTNGVFVVGKLCNDEQQTSVAFPKSELVDIIVWRHYLMTQQRVCVSSRLHRENMIRVASGVSTFPIMIETEGLRRYVRRTTASQGQPQPVD